MTPTIVSISPSLPTSSKVTQLVVTCNKDITESNVTNSSMYVSAQQQSGQFTPPGTTYTLLDGNVISNDFQTTTTVGEYTISDNTITITLESEMYIDSFHLGN